MNNLILSTLDRIEIGIILIDSDQKIVLWNRYVERLSNVFAKSAIGKRLDEVCPIFRVKRYQDILTSVLELGQSRFCSSKLHKSFIFPAGASQDAFRQNLYIEAISAEGNEYALIQVDDITNTVTSEQRLTSLINELRRGYLEVKESEELTRQLAYIDPLTNIWNRHAMNEQIENLLRKPEELARSAMLFLDLDCFKHVNDTYGHTIGDFLLAHVAGLLTKIMRREDTVARLGGDEFVILLRSIETVEAAEIVGQKIVKAIAAPIETENGTCLHVTASVGIALYGPEIQSAVDYIKASDIAMYRAKKGGKNGVVVVRGLSEQADSEH